MEAMNELHRLRLSTMTTQAIMAEHIGIAARTYKDIETGKTTIRPIHVNAARWACISIQAAGLSGQADLPNDVREPIECSGFVWVPSDL